MARQKGHRRDTRVREAAPARYAQDRKEAQLTGVLYDSDVIIEILRGRPGVTQAAHALEASGVPTYCTPISTAEIYAGIRPGEEGLATAFLRSRGELILDGTVGRRAGNYLAKYTTSHGVQIADALIAAAASTTGLALWTLNKRHYPMPDLDFYEP